MDKKKELFEKIFTILKFTDSEKEQANKDLDLLMQKKTIAILVENAPAEQQSKFENMEDVEDVGQQAVAVAALKKSYSQEEIQKYALQSFVETIVFYVSNMFENKSEQDRQQALDVLKEYGFVS
jgi:hypothetical protein